MALYQQIHKIYQVQVKLPDVRKQKTKQNKTKTKTITAQ